MSNVADSGEEHTMIYRMFMVATMNAATFMGKNFVEIQNSIINSRDLTLKHMFDITSKLVSEQDEMNNLDNRGIYFIDPEDTEFKETIKNARKKLETSVAPAMPGKILIKNCGSGASNKIKTKLVYSGS